MGMVSHPWNFVHASWRGMRDRRRERYLWHGFGLRMDTAIQWRPWFRTCLSHSQLAGLSAVSAQRSVPGCHRISADPVSARRGSQPNSDPRFLLHCRRSRPLHWGRNVEVSALGLGIMLLAQMPLSSVWFIGFAIGVDLIFDGASLIGFATALHRLAGVALEGVV